VTVLDVPRRARPARVMVAARTAGLHWAVRVGLDQAGLLTTTVTRTGPGGAVAFRVPDPAPRPGQLVSMWMDRNPWTPALLLLHTTPDVVHASAVLASGGRRYVRLSPVAEDLWLRFGVVPLPAEDPLACVEVRSRLRGLRLIELWRPPGRRLSAAAPAAARTTARRTGT
jgi:hypothetical protein